MHKLSAFILSTGVWNVYRLTTPFSIEEHCSSDDTVIEQWSCETVIVHMVT